MLSKMSTARIPGGMQASSPEAASATRRATLNEPLRFLSGAYPMSCNSRCLSNQEPYSSYVHDGFFLTCCLSPQEPFAELLADSVAIPGTLFNPWENDSFPVLLVCIQSLCWREEEKVDRTSVSSPKQKYSAHNGWHQKHFQ